MNKTMQKLLAILLCGLLVIGLCACGGDEAPEGESAPVGGSESESIPADDSDNGSAESDPSGDTPGEDEPGEDEPGGDQPEPMKKKTFTLSTDMEGVKTYGVRMSDAGRGIPCDWAGSGFEFSFNLDNGDFFFTLAASASADLLVFLDGEIYKADDGSDLHHVGTSTAMLALKGVEPGDHTVKVIRISDYGRADVDVISAIFAGTIDTDKTYEEASYYVEFLGDQVTSGKNLLGEDDYDVTLAYSYKTAQALNADYSITSISGLAVNSGENTAEEMYDLVSPKYESGIKYNFARKADAIVINLGVNDLATFDANTFRMDYLDLLFAVRGANGADSKIYCVYGTGEMAESIKGACADFGGEAAGVYTIAFEGLTDNETYPTAEQHAAFATALTTLISETKDDEITVIPKKGGIGVIIDWSEGKVPEV